MRHRDFHLSVFFCVDVVVDMPCGRPQLQELFFVNTQVVNAFHFSWFFSCSSSVNTSVINTTLRNTIA